VLASLLASGLVIVAAHPQGGQVEDGRPERAGWEVSRKRRSDDFVVIEAEEPRQGRVLISETPVDNSGAGVANFRLPLPQFDDVVVVEAGGDDEAAGRFLSDIPRDLNFGSQAGPRLPIANEFNDSVVIEAAGDNEGEGRALSDIPRDFSGPQQAGFKLPKPDLGSIKEVFDDFEIVEVGDSDEAGRSLSAIPTDNSQPGQAGFRLPISDDFEVVEVGDIDEAGRSLSVSPTDNSLPGQAGFRLPISDDFVVLEADNGRQAQTHSISSRDRSDCFKPLKRSRCRALLSFWFFNNHSKTCQEYKFGGCDSEVHSNRFETHEDCMQLCASGAV